MELKQPLELVPPRPASDAELLRAFFEGDAGAFDTLVGRHQGPVLAVLRRYGRSAADAEDLAQRAFVKLLTVARRHARWRDDVPVRAWLLRVAMNLGINHARDEGRRERAHLLVVPDARGAEPADALLAAAQRRRAVARAVAQLPKRQREVFTLRVDLGEPFAEVAQLLGITENNAKVHFHHAVRRLKELVPHLTGERP